MERVKQIWSRVLLPALVLVGLLVGASPVGLALAPAEPRRPFPANPERAE